MLSFSVSLPAVVQFPEMGGVVHDPVTLPAKTSAVRFQRRMCGDVYCEIEGSKFVAGFGPDAPAAFDEAMRKAA